MSANVPSTMTVLTTLVAITWKRLFRGRALWICAAIAMLPALFAFAVRDQRDGHDAVAGIQIIVTGLLSAVFVASAIGEEIEEKTITYLWSRPLARWTIIIGKVLALAPVSIALTLAGWVIASQVALGVAPDPQTLIALVADALVTSAVAAGIATLVPRQGMALSIIYLVIVDIAIGAIPASIHEISVSYQVVSLSGLDESASNPPHAAIALVIISAIWITIGMLRVRRLEA